MKKILLPILAFILFACSPNAPALQVTVIPKMTVTLPVTQTSTPTSTVVPTSVPDTATPTIEIPAYVENVKIVSNPLEFRRAPVIKTEDFPALAQVLMKRFLAGDLGEFPENSHYVPFYFSTSGFNYHGITKVLNPIVGNPNDLYGMDKRWYFLDSIYKEEGTGRMISHYFVQQKDGTPGQFFANFGPNPLSNISNKVLTKWALGGDDIWAMPVDFATMEGCLEFVPGDQDYCNDRLTNREKDLEVYKAWAATGMVPLEISSGRMKVVMQGQHVKKPLGN
ncbi:MAG: hypothetical protein PHQ36_13235 [Anaerolineales bacterium]|nr:hypothetical protein [Anaerolineales bacterium]